MPFFGALDGQQLLGGSCTTNLNDLWPYTFRLRPVRVRNNNNKPFDRREPLFARILHVIIASGQPLAACDSAAVRRRQRRLPSWLRHERTTIAVPMAEKLHHSAQRLETARVGEWGGEMNFTATIREPLPTPQPELFRLCEEEPCGALTGFLPCPGRRSGFCGAPCGLARAAQQPLTHQTP